MSDTDKQKKHWRLKVELVILACVICIWIIKLVTVDIDSTKAAVLKQVVKIKPNSADTHLNLGNTYYDSGNYEGAIEAYKEAIRIDPNLPWPHICIAFTYQDLQRYEEAIKEWKQVIKLEPDIAGLHSILGEVYIQTGQYLEAVQNFQNAILIDQNHARAHSNLGKTYIKIEDIDSAWDEYEILKNLDEELANELLRLIDEHKTQNNQ